MTILDDADSVREDDVSIYEVDNPDEVMDELGAPEYDDDGYIIQQGYINEYNRLNQNTGSNNYKDNPKNKNNDTEDVEKDCLKCCVLIVTLYFLWSLFL